MKDPKLLDVSELWLQRARSDLRLGEVALNTPDVMFEDACFHAQQSAEKALKGLLSQRNIPFPRTPAIEVLLDLLKNAGTDIPLEIDEAFTLTQYAVETRYPGHTEPIDKDEAQKALLLSAKVLVWVEQNVKDNPRE
jgi:HEPN domain-containing protein